MRIYPLANDEESNLSTTPLPDRLVRVICDGLSYLAQQTIKYVPIGDKIELNLGVHPKVMFELVKTRSAREETWTQIHGTDMFQKVGDDALQMEINSAVVGWNDALSYQRRIHNYTARPINVGIRRTYDGHVAFVG